MATRLPLAVNWMCGLSAVFACLSPGILQAAEWNVPNGSFESQSLQGWTPRTFSGRAPQVEVVEDTYKEGRRSLRISAALPTDFSLTRDIRALGGSAWRLRAWIKTQDLVSQGKVQYGGTIQIRTIDNRATLAEAVPQLGTSDWREVDIPFRVPSNGQVLLALVLVNVGPGTGTVWFDDLRLERVPPRDVEEKVLDFPIDWSTVGSYNKFLPTDGKGRHCGWSCGQVALGMILRYWSRKVALPCSGTYFYYAQGTGERMSVEFSTPLQWNRMLPSLRGVAYEDQRADPVADLVRRISIARRTEWPPLGDGLGWVAGHELVEVMAKHFGFDLSEWRFIYARSFIRAGQTWDELAAIVRREIDADRPVIMGMSDTRGGGHTVVITGYRRIGPHYRFMIQWGVHGRYDPAIAWPLDGWIGAYDLPLTRQFRIGLKPDTTHKQVPLYNKQAEIGDTDYDGLTHAGILWNNDRGEYAAVFPAGPKTGQHLCFQRISPVGLPVGEALFLRPSGNCRKPVIAWSGQVYGLAWENRSDKIGTIYFTRVSPEGQLLQQNPVCVGSGADDASRPSLSLAWNGKEFAVVWVDQGQVRFMRISADGAPVSNSQKAIAGGIDPHLVWLGDSYVLTFVGAGSVQLVRLEAAGEGKHKPCRIFPQPNRGTWTPRVCWSGSQFGIAWEHVRPDGRHQICFARADAQCNPIAGSLRMISDFNDPPAWVLWPAISSHKGEFIVTYHRGDAYLTRLSAKGDVLENRYLFWSPSYLTHVTNGDVTNVLYVHANTDERIVEVESCLFPLETSDLGPAPMVSQTRK